MGYLTFCLCPVNMENDNNSYRNEFSKPQAVLNMLRNQGNPKKDR